MATKTIAWQTGSGNITVDYGGVGDGTITISSDSNSLYEVRSQQITVRTTDGSDIERTITIQQAAKVRIDISTAIVTAANQTYSGSAKTPTPTVTLNGETIPSSGYDVSYSNNTNAGTAAITVTGKGDYTGTAAGSFTINKATPTVVAPTAKVLTYNETAQALVNAGSTDFGTLKYSLDNSTWSTSIPTATNQGSYTVYYKVDGDSNVNNVAVQSITCSINEKKVTATVELSQLSYTYSGSACTPDVTVKDGSTIIPASEYTVTYSNNINAGTGTVTISDNVGGNYEVIGSATFTIGKANINPSVNINGWTYGGTASNPSVSGNPGGGDVSYSYKANGAPDTSYTTTKPSNAGEYVVRAIVAETANYLGATVTNTFTIAQCEVALTWGDTSWTYDKSAHSTTCTAGNLVTGDTCTVTLTGNSITNKGTTTVTASSLSNSNYKLPSANTTTLTVNARVVTLSWGTLSWTYDGSAHNTTCTAGNLCSGDTCTVTLTGNSITSKGTATVTASSLSNSNYTLPSDKTATLTITARPINVTASSASKTYDGTALTSNSATAEAAGTNRGLVSGHSMTSCTVTGTIINAGSASNVPSAAVIKTSGGTEVTSNYDITYVNGTLAVSKAAGSVTTAPVNNNYVYNGNSRNVASAGSGTGTMYYKLGDGSWSTSMPKMTSAGSDTLYYYAAESANYTQSDTGSITVTVQRASQSAPSVSGATTTYPNTATATASGGGGVGSIEWESAQSQSSVGSHTTRARWSGNSNYEASPWSDYVTVQMNKAAGSVSISGVSLTYNGDARSLASVSGNTGTMHYSTDYSSWSTSIPTGTNASSYTVYWYMDASTNYEGISASSSRYVSSSIAKADQSAPTAYGATTTYPTTATASASGGGGVGSIEWYNGNTQTNVGWMTTYARWSGNENYNPSAWSNEVTLTMNKASGSVNISGVSSSYSGSSQSLASVSDATGTMHYSTDYSNWSTSIPVSTNAGSWTIYWYMDASTNYEGISASISRYVSSSIAKIAAPITTEPVAKTGLVYNGTAQQLCTNGVASIAGTWNYPTSINAATTVQGTAYFTPTDSTNYNQYSKLITTSIAKASRTLSFADSYVVLDTSSNVTKTATPSAGSGDGAITYSISSTTYATINSSSGKVTSKTSDGSGVVTAIIAEGTNYLSATASYNLYVFATTHNYDYNGSYRSVTLPPGTYQFQCWGAQGGSNAAESSYDITAQAGGKGGYSVGQLTVAQETSVRVYVGGQGSSYAGGFNGGGSTSGSASYNSAYEYGVSRMGGGGGATDIRLSDGALLSRMIVAGGGSGGAMCYRSKTTSSTITDYSISSVQRTITAGTLSIFVLIEAGSLVAGQTYTVSGIPSGYNYDWKWSNKSDAQNGEQPFKLISNTSTITAPSGYSYFHFYVYGNNVNPPSGFTVKITHSSSSTSTSTDYQVGFVGGGTEGGAMYSTSTTVWTTVASGSSGSQQGSSGYYYKRAITNCAVDTSKTYRVKVTQTASKGSTHMCGVYYMNGTSVKGMEVVAYGSYKTLSFPADTTSINIESYDASQEPDDFSAIVQRQDSSYQGTQNAAGTGGSFGQGANQTVSNYRYCSGAGGGGWYGGGGGQYNDSSMTYCKYSGGGSGFVNTAASAGNRPSGYTGLQLDSGETKAGNTSFPSTSGGNETGHSGNGYARITKIS